MQQHMHKHLQQHMSTARMHLSMLRRCHQDFSSCGDAVNACAISRGGVAVGADAAASAACALAPEPYDVCDVKER